MIRKEMHSMLAALVFFTRVPCPPRVALSPGHFAACARYFSLVGWLVGACSALVYWGSAWLFPPSVSVLLCLLSSLLLTGALHEDGLADVCDGFGGGWSKERILAIMKDSSIGVYGAIGIAMSLLLKFCALQESPAAHIPLLLIAAHPLSRLMALTLMCTHAYVRDDAQAKSKQVVHRMNPSDLFVAMLFGLTPLLLFRNPFVFLVLVPLLITKWLMARYFYKWIGGYTGDCLGAVQQVSEVVFYLTMLAAPWNYF